MENVALALIPYPKYITYRQEMLAIMPIMEICDPMFARPAKAFAGYAQRLVGVRFTEGRGASVVLRVDPDMQSGEYSLRVQTARVVLCAADAQGMQYALATLGQLMRVVAEKLSQLPPVTIYEPEYVAPMPMAGDPTELTIEHLGSTWVITGQWLEHLIVDIDFDDYEARNYFDLILRRCGLFQRLEDMGIQDGDTVDIYDFEFEYQR